MMAVMMRMCRARSLLPLTLVRLRGRSECSAERDDLVSM